MLHEVHTSEEAQFLTLTYSNENLPLRGTDTRGILVKSDLQKFFKRVRKGGHEFRYYACGEYGDRFSRPHFHAVVFGMMLAKEQWQVFWPLGEVYVGTATEQSIRYVSGYVSKKLGLGHYEDDSRPAPFQISSKGIGQDWAKENLLEALVDGCLIYRGKKLPIPRAYKDWYEQIFPEAIEGFSARQSWESDLRLSDLVLELLPEAGGASWSELSESEKENVLIQLHKRGDQLDANLRAAAAIKEKESKL